MGRREEMHPGFLLVFRHTKKKIPDKINDSEKEQEQTTRQAGQPQPKAEALTRDLATESRPVNGSQVISLRPANHSSSRTTISRRHA
jgi:hypothetical protein